MRTTVEFPPELFRKAKARAAARGETLKALLTRAVAAEVGQGQTAARQRMTLPTFGDPSGPTVKLSGTDIARILADEDAALASRFSRRRSR